MRSVLPLLFVSLALSTTGVERVHAEAKMAINLAGPADWNTELPWVDVFRMARPWISQREGAGWGQGPELSLDENGYPTRLPEGVFAESMLCTIEGGRYPQGGYTVLYDGTGRIEFARASVVDRSPGRMVVKPHGSKGFSLQLHETDPDDRVRNIRVIMPGFEDTYAENPWHPVFLGRWRGMASIRFMDFMHTNDSEVSSWAQRPEPDDMTFSKKGVPVELMVDLANRVDADPWFCMPHAADDGYVRRFAEYVAENLDPDLDVYVEYSNEVWNGQFDQNEYAAKRGQELGLAEKPWQAAWLYTARRSVEVFGLWEQAFGGADRLVRVIPSQAANPYVAKQILGHADAADHADALAIAPYMGIVPKGEQEAREVAALGVEGVLDRLETEVLPEVIATRFRGNKAVADSYGLELIAYEAGQHLVGTRGAENHQPLTDVFHAANRHPRMGELYTKYFEAWDSVGGGAMAHFSSISSWSKWGSWGLMQYYDQDPANSPKFQAVIDAAQSWGQSLEAVSLEGGAAPPAAEPR